MDRAFCKLSEPRRSENSLMPSVEAEVMCRGRTSKVILLPPATVAPKDDLLLIVRRRVVMKVGAREFSADMTAKVRPLPDACVSLAPHVATVYSISGNRFSKKQGGKALAKLCHVPAAKVETYVMSGETETLRRNRGNTAMINKCRMSIRTPSRFLHASRKIKTGRWSASGCRLPWPGLRTHHPTSAANGFGI